MDVLKSNDTTIVYKEAIETAACAFAYHEAIFDNQGRMVDYRFLDINPSFENMTGLTKDQVVGKCFVEDIAQDKEHAFTWVKRYEKVITGKTLVEFEDYSQEYRKHFAVKAYPIGDNQFVTLFLDVTFEKKFREIAAYFRDNMGKKINYDEVTKYVCDLSGAEYAAFNLYEKDGTFTTVSLYGLIEKVQDVLEHADLKILGRKWEYDPFREEKIQNRSIALFPSLRELVGGVIDTKIVLGLEKSLRIGQVAVAKIQKDETIFGDFTLFFREGGTFKNENLIHLYISQLGLFIEKTRLEQSLRSSQNRFYTLAEYAPIGFVSCNTEGKVTYANRKLLEILDSPSLEETKKWNLLTLPPLKEARFSEKLAESIQNNRCLIHEMEYVSIWGKHSWLRVYFTPNIEKSQVVGVNIVVDDITEKKEDEEKLRERAYQDSLTKAYNRYALDTILTNRLWEAREEALICCIAVVDVDDFKQINDHHGHRAGDTVLKSLASRIKHGLREKDMLVRTGGDEFLVYYHDMQGGDNANKRLKELFEKVSSQYGIDDLLTGDHLDLEVICSIGAALFPQHGETVEELMAKADGILYEIKEAGKGTYQLAL
jgi:diguanylate cyclase (GGDEF)-like protein/PAS domain S-box-containing protein